MLNISHLKKIEYIDESIIQKDNNILNILNNRISICIEFVDISLMNEKEIKSTVNQLIHAYSYYKKDLTINFILSNIKQISKYLTEGTENWNISKINESILDLKLNKEIIILSGDAEEVLECLNENDIYVIAGFVDRNRHKNYTKNLAEKYNLKSKRLPIKENIKLKTSAILSINQVFQILLSYKNNGNWKETLLENLPKRKIYIEK